MRICEAFFFSWYFLKVIFIQSDKKVAYFHLYEEIMVVLKLLGKTQLGFGSKSMLIKFFNSSGGNMEGSVCLACCGGKFVTSPKAAHTCHLVSG